MEVMTRIYTNINPRRHCYLRTFRAVAHTGPRSKETRLLTISRVSPRVECDSEGLAGDAVTRGSIARVDVEQRSTEAHVGHQGELGTGSGDVDVRFRLGSGPAFETRFTRAHGSRHQRWPVQTRPGGLQTWGRNQRREPAPGRGSPPTATGLRRLARPPLSLLYKSPTG